jgi:phosphoribosyl-AMP cyclohydrolase
MVFSRACHISGQVRNDLCCAIVAIMGNREHGTELQPKWDVNGLITGIVTDAASGELLMVAHLNEEALRSTLKTGEAHFWSRSRGKLWKKGESSGNVLRVVELRVDCDQDSLWLKVDPVGPACHTGERSCFYRRVTTGAALEPATD